MKMESIDTIKVRRQSNLNKRMKVFMNAQILQHREKVFFIFHETFEVKLIG